MAFVLKQMNACGGQSRSRKVVAGGAGDTVEVTPAVWSYFHADDNLATIRADGYFNGARQLLSPGDCVIVSPNGASIDLLTIDTVPLSAGGADVTTGTLISSSSAINVKSFGAKGDGVTDDTAAIQAALDTGKNVYIPGVDDPATQYYLLTVALQMNDNQEIVGDGWASILRQLTTNANVIEIFDKDHVTVRNLHLYAHGTKSSLSNGTGVHISSLPNPPRYCKVLNCFIENHRGNGVNLEDARDCIVANNVFLNSPVTTSDTNQTAGADISFQYASQRNTAYGNKCRSGNAFGIQVLTIDAADDASDNIIVGNTIQDCLGYGIMVYRLNEASDVLQRTIVEGNNVRNIDGDLEEVTQGAVYGAGIYIQGAEDTVVTGNNVSKTHSGVKATVDILAPAAIGATNLARINISDNVIEEAGWVGIDVNDPNNNGLATGMAVVSNNVITNTVREGIRVLQRGRVKIIGNVIDDTTREGIHVNNTVTQRELISVIDNTIRNSGRNGIEVDFAEAVKVEGNTVTGAVIHGIAVGNCDDISVLDNTVLDTTVRGIHIISTVTRGQLSGNTVRGNGSSVEGMRLDANLRYGENYVSNNVTEFVGDWGPIRTLPVDDTTPDVTDGKHFVTANTVPTTITNLDGGDFAQTVHIVFRDANTTIDFTGSNMKGNTGVDFVAAVNDSMTCVRHPALFSWICDVSDNTA